MDLNKKLIELELKGYAPCLVNDDDGRWAVSCDGAQPGWGRVKWMNVDLTDAIWCDTPQEALEKYLEQIAP